MALVQVQQFGHGATPGGGSTGSAMIMAAVVIAVLVTAALLLVRDWRQLYRVGDRLAREAQRWLRHQPPPP